jgi:N-methylhydantoinase B
MNDPFDGGMHPPDILCSPIYHGGERVAFACTVCHHTDVGAASPAGMLGSDRDLRRGIQCLKMYEAGRSTRR